MKEESINILDYFDTKININSPAGRHDDRSWNFCNLCDFVSLQSGGKIGGMANQSIKMHLIKKHGIRMSVKRKWEISSEKVKEASK